MTGSCRATHASSLVMLPDPLPPGAGIAGMAGSREPPRQRPAKQSSNTFDDSFVKVEYPSYPVLAPGTPGSQAASHAGSQPRYEPYAGPSSQHSQEPMYQAPYQPQQQPQQQHQQHQPEPAYGAPAGFGQPSGQPGYHSFEPARQELVQQAQQQPPSQGYAPAQQVRFQSVLCSSSGRWGCRSFQA